MDHLQTNHSTFNRVFAVFESSVHSFDMPRDASFADLAGRLAQLGERYEESLIRVEVTTNARAKAEARPH
ncbi:MAG: hypothetical protein ACYC1L_02915 [Alphaproteobacteria bacterium]